MQIQFNIDCKAQGHERTENYFTTVISDALRRFEDKITRIDVRIADENNSKSASDDKRCVLEVHAAGFKPMAVTNHADTMEKAIKGSVEKMKHALEHHYGKLQTH